MADSHDEIARDVHIHMWRDLHLVIVIAFNNPP